MRWLLLIMFSTCLSSSHLSAEVDADSQEVTWVEDAYKVLFGVSYRESQAHEESDELAEATRDIQPARGAVESNPRGIFPPTQNEQEGSGHSSKPWLKGQDEHNQDTAWLWPLTGPSEESSGEGVLGTIYGFFSDDGEADCVEPAEEECVEPIAVEQEVQAVEEVCEGPCRRCLGQWLPAESQFAPFIADPRNPQTSVAVRWNDEVFAKETLAASFGAHVPLLRRSGWGPCCGGLELAVEAGVFSLFDISRSDLLYVNSDFFFALPVSYRWNSCALRLRVLHESGHLGDEFLLANPGFERLNPSYEAVDLFFAFYPSECMRFFVGGGYIFDNHHSFDVKHAYAEFGGEATVPSWCFECDQLTASPFVAVHVRLTEDNDWDIDGNYELGLELDRLGGIGRVLRIFMEYHDGYSREGQFTRQKNTYFALRAAYGY